jgi:DNA-binding XRE family transcriptional regulator
MTEEEPAQLVQRARAKFKLSQEDFGALLGVSRHTIIRYEAGGPVPETTRLAIAQLLLNRKIENRKKRKRKSK